jgi:hypothetical protein
LTEDVGLGVGAGAGALFGALLTVDLVPPEELPLPPEVSEVSEVEPDFWEAP